MARDVVNALCVDADDLISSVREAGWSVRSGPSEVGGETRSLLESLAASGLLATFFLPGHCVAAAPDLVRAIGDAGHQVASHGTVHAPVYRMTPAAFLEDVRRSKGVLEDLLGRPVDTYKAPIWSITAACVAWAYDALLEAGYTVDHSAMPRVVEALGRPRGWAEPFAYQGALAVVPVTALPLAGFSLPLPGGFYNAWCPFAIQRRLYDNLNRRALPFNFYFHPFEHSPAAGKRRLVKHGSLRLSLYAAHAGRYRHLLTRVARRYRLSTLEVAYSRWLGGA